MTIYKRIGSLILSLLLVFCMFGSTFAIQTFAATSPALSAESKTVNAGEQFTVAVTLANATTVYGGNFTLQYDSSLLTADSYEFSSIVSGHTKNCNLNYQSAGNLIRVTFSGASAVTSSGTLITFTFTAKENVYGSAALQFNAYKMYDENGSAISSNASGSTITIVTELVVSPTLSITSETVTVGNTVSVPIVISDSEAVYGGNFTLQYDSNLLTADSYSFGNIVSGHTKNCNLNYQSAGNLIRVTFSGADAVSSDGTLVTFTFTAKVTGTANLQFNTYKMYDENGSSIKTTANGSTIVIEPKPELDSLITGQCGDTLTYSYDPTTYTLTISGEGNMWEWERETTPWWNFKESITCVKIEKGVTNVGDFAFAGFTSLRNVYFSDSITSIGASSFSLCISLEEIALPNSIHTIESGAFYNCQSLNSVTLPNSVETLGNSLFGKCIRLKNFVFPSSVTNVGDRLFDGCTSLCEVTFSKSMNSIPAYAFLGCTGLKEMEIPSYITSIGDHAFENCSNLEYVYILGNITSIHKGMFIDCTSLKTIAIPESVTSIGDIAFQGCSNLKNVFIPNSVKSIGWAAFSDCSDLSSITIPDSVILIDSSAFNGTAYYNNQNNWENDILYIDNHLIKAKTSITLCNIKSGTKTIAKSAFYKCELITNVIIPESVISIGDASFYNCSSLLSISIPDSVMIIGNRAFFGCSNLTSIIIPNDVTNLGYETFFDCYSLTSITIPNSVTNIGRDSFANCNDIIIYGYNGTYAEIYANENNIPFVEIETIKIDSVSIKTIPIKTTYYIGDSLNTSGLKLLATYSDGSTETITSGFTTSAFCSGTPGIKTVTVSYGEFTNTFTVEVKTISATLFTTELSLNINDSQYIQYEIDPNDVSEFDNYIWKSKDTSVATVDSNGMVKAVGVGSTEIYLSISRNGFGTASNLCTINVNNGISGVSICKNPYQTIYYTGDALNTIGLELLVAYEDGSTKTVTSGFTTSGFSSTTAGTKMVTVSYEGFTDTFAVTVEKPKISFDNYETDDIIGLYLGVPKTFEVTTTPGNQNVTFWVTHPEYLSVSGNTITATKDVSGFMTLVAEFTYNDVKYSNTLIVMVFNYYACNLGGDRVGYMDFKTGTLSITGSGDMPNYADFGDAPWNNEAEYVKKIVISEGITSIGDYAFVNCINAKEVEIASTVKTIGIWAFEDCWSFETLVIPESVEEIKDYAFYWCSGLKDIYIYNDSVLIGNNALDCEYGNATIHGYKNSTAETHAAKYGRPFEAFDSILSGDTNGDGKINGKDYALVLQSINGWNVTVDKDAADVNGDGKINGKDYALLLQFINGWDVKLQ